jgi:hypothetical protein
MKADAGKYLFNKIIMGDETWWFAYDPETKQQSSEWVGETSPQPKKLKFQKSCIKTMLIIFLSLKAQSTQNLNHRGITVNAEFYKRAMDHLLKRI